MDQYPVKHEPDQNVDHVEGDGVDPEEDVGREGGEGPGEHALGERLQQDGVGQHGRAQLDPAKHNNKVTQVWHDQACSPALHSIFAFPW